MHDDPPHRDADGGSVRVPGAFIEADPGQRAAREAAEATLRCSEAELRSAQRIAGVGSWSLDPQQHRLRLSAAAMAALGMAAEPFEGTPRDLLSWIHPEDRERTRLAMRASSTSGSMYEFEHCIQREDGGIGWALARAEPVAQPGGGTLWIGSVLDITARKQTELRLREQVARLALLGRITRAIGDRTQLQTVLDIVAEQIALHLPAQLCALLLHDPEQPQRLQLAAASGSAAAALRAALAEPGAAAAPGPVPRSMPVLAEAAEVLPRRLAAAGLGSAEQLPLAEPGVAPGMMLIARADPRAFSARETDFLQQLAEHVALAVRQARLHGDLRQAYEQLERTQAATLQQERLAALGSMSGGAAHDINNALSPAALYVESLLAREAGLSARGRGQLEAIQRAIEDVSGTLERMRAFSHRDRAAALAGIDLGELVRGFAGQFDARWCKACRAPGTAIALRIETPDAPLPVHGARAELAEALAELVANAVDAMPRGGTLTLRAAPGAGGSGAVLVVADDGAGMDEATRRRCIEPFFSTKGERGSGMGLARVWGTAQRHGAQLHIDSRSGGGTRVTLRFAPAPSGSPPAADATSTVPAGRSACTGPIAVGCADGARPLRVLVVDDDELLRSTLAQILQAEAVRVELAAGGGQAIEAAAAAVAAGDPFDLVLTDLGMPGVDGQQVAAAVKRLQPPPRVVMLTGWGRGMAADDTLPPHVDQLLPKPPRLADLRAVLRDAGRPDAGRRPGSE